MAITPATRKADDKLREALKNADLKKFDKAIESIFPKTKQKAAKRINKQRAASSR